VRVAMRGINAHTQRLAWTRQRGQRASALSLRLTGRRPSAWSERPSARASVRVQAPGPRARRQIWTALVRPHPHGRNGSGTRARVQGSASDTYPEPASRASLPSPDSTPPELRPPCNPAERILRQRHLQRGSVAARTARLPVCWDFHLVLAPPTAARRLAGIAPRA